MASPFGLSATLGEFVPTDTDRVLGALTARAAARRLSGAVEAQQVAAWRESIGWLARAGAELCAGHPNANRWTLCLEYEIPRRGSRIDAVLLAEGLIFVIEFKSTSVDVQAQRQAEDYGLELYDFHQASHGRKIFPIACGSKAALRTSELNAKQGVASCSTCRPESLANLILGIVSRYSSREQPQLPAEDWLTAPYHPTPTIIEAARALYAGHSIRDLSQSEASAAHLRSTQSAVEQVVRDAHARGRRAICFITGVPGAGKTLAGLNVVHGLDRELHSTFLSGNGPLVKVLQAVLTSDLRQREQLAKSEASRRASALVTNVHRWIDAYYEQEVPEAPHESVVIFDEAQRAWSRDHSMRKFGRDASEPEAILEVMSRRTTAVLVCLVGGGQEINTGEAGLAEWGKALAGQFKEWDIIVSPGMSVGLLESGTSLFGTAPDAPLDRVRTDPNLHLGVSQRSFRAERLSEWVELVLAGSPDEASRVLERLGRYPIVMSRSLRRARQWLREHARGLRRTGLLVSSGARRLRQAGISVSEPVDPVHWFLNSAQDVRSSNFLELPMTEFGVQGLEVDWACLAWGADLTRADGAWLLRDFRGTKWQLIKDPNRRAYAINRYRVLLTRAREGMVLWIPKGDPDDVTQDPKRYQSVYDYLIRCGVREV